MRIAENRLPLETTNSPKSPPNHTSPVHPTHDDYSECEDLENRQLFSSNGVYSAFMGLVTQLCKSFKCMWEPGHVCIHKAHFPSSQCSAQLFCLHCTLVCLFCRRTKYLLSSPDPILALASMDNAPVFTPPGYRNTRTLP